MRFFSPPSYYPGWLVSALTIGLAIGAAQSGFTQTAIEVLGLDDSVEEPAPSFKYPAAEDSSPQRSGGIMPIPSVAVVAPDRRGAVGPGIGSLHSQPSSTSTDAGSSQNSGQSDSNQSPTQTGTPSDDSSPGQSPTSSGSGGGDYMDVAASQLGVSENGTTNRSAQVDAYHNATDGQLGAPWCSSFVNWSMEQAGYTGTDSASSQSWKNWGEDAGGPERGSVVVFSNGDGTGHVGFIDSVNSDGSLNVLGGNQSGKVSVSKFSTDKVVAYRKPTGSSGGQVVQGTNTGGYETNTR